jgi:hypothetical protein
MVRITTEGHLMKKGYLSHFSEEIFTISKIFNSRYPQTYKLYDRTDSEDLEGVFYAEELVRVLPKEKADGVRLIEKILKSDPPKKPTRHLVQWKDTKETSWIDHGELFDIHAPSASSSRER